MDRSDSNIVLVKIGSEECEEEFEVDVDLVRSKVPNFCEILNNIENDLRLQPVFTDITPDGFRHFIRYSTIGEVRFINVSECKEVWQVAQKFGFQQLENECQDFLRRSLKPQNALEVYSIATYFSSEVLKKEYFSCLEKNTREIFKFADFINSDETTIEGIVKCPQLSLDSEVDLFSVVVEWGQSECLRRGFSCTPDNLRAVLHPLIPHIRFLEMTPEEFVEHVIPKKLLSIAEERAILVNLIDTNARGVPVPKGFSTVQGCRTYTGTTEITVCNYDNTYFSRVTSDKPFLCTLKVNEGTICIHKLYFPFVYRRSAKFHVTFDVSNSVKGGRFVSGTSFSANLHYSDGDYSVECPPVRVRAGEIVSIKAKVIDSDSQGSFTTPQFKSFSSHGITVVLPENAQNALYISKVKFFYK